LSHGDTKHIALFPANPEECFYLAVEAFDLAERFQTPVFVVSDLDIGMNDWMCRRLTWNDAYRPDRGKVLGAEELERIQRFSRYLDTDGDGIAARTLPGVHPRGGYFTRGSGHDKHGAYTEDAADYQEVVDRLTRKFVTASNALPAPEFHLQSESGSADIGIVSIGGCHAAVLEAVDRLRNDGRSVDYMRLRAFPFPPSVRAFIESHERCYVVEQNRDGQLRTLLAIETGVARDRLSSVLDYGGLPLTADRVVRGVRGANSSPRVMASGAPVIASSEPVSTSS
jgi:2-oxoglutarate ferredoxin oxidoreductase subunit alpha